MKKKQSVNWIILSVCIAIIIVLIVAISLLLQEPEAETPADTDNVKLLFFGKDTFDSSVQSESERIDWNKYSSMPLDLSLTQTYFNDDPYFVISAPGWELSKYDSTIVFHESPVYIAVTVQETNRVMLNKTVDNLSQFEILTGMRELEKETINIGNYKIEKITGACNAETSMIELRKYVSYTFGDGVMQYCFMGVTTYSSDTTVECLAESIENMIHSISFNGLA
jgi:hypothetical protein